ncbi:MAG TPA: hypothetical protein EYQ64_05840 [Gemmatimonadetes bacterium]|nr:hypothetical protein [Gemmatimonadota bacterium]
MVDALQGGQRGLALDRLLRGVLDGAILNVLRGKKLLRAFTALSSRAEVLPIQGQGRGHGFSLF